MMRNLRRWPADQIMEPVPDSLAVCEFDCRAVECLHGGWTRGQYRLCHDGGRLESRLLRPKGACQSRPDEGTVMSPGDGPDRWPWDQDRPISARRAGVTP
jgi:hypothetical protein